MVCIVVHRELQPSTFHLAQGTSFVAIFPSLNRIILEGIPFGRMSFRPSDNFDGDLGLPPWTWGACTGGTRRVEGYEILNDGKPTGYAVLCVE